jgi:hypothetical protein
MRHIAALAPDIIKVDRSLVRGINTNAARRAMVASLMLFALGLNQPASAKASRPLRSRRHLRNWRLTPLKVSDFNVRRSHRPIGTSGPALTSRTEGPSKRCPVSAATLTRSYQDPSERQPSDAIRRSDQSGAGREG